MARPAPDASTRLRWIDGARGLGILLVVYGHAERALFAKGPVPAWAAGADRTIYAFHMPLFFVLAGLFVWPSLSRGRRRFATDKLVTVVYPYFLWSVIEGVLALLLASRVNAPPSLHDLASIPIAPIEQFWFLYVLALCFGLALLCYPSRAAAAGVAAIGLAVVARFGAVAIGLRTLFFFPFVAIGIVFAEPILALGDTPRRAAMLLVGALTVFTTGLAAGWGGLAGLVGLALAGTGAAVAAAVLLNRSPAGPALALLGRGSLAIYVMHTICSAGLRIALQEAGLAVPVPSLLVLTTGAGVVVPLGLWLAADRLGITLPLGLGRPSRRPRRAGAVAPRPSLQAERA